MREWRLLAKRILRLSSTDWLHSLKATGLIRPSTLSSRDDLWRQYRRDDDPRGTAVISVEQVGFLRPEKQGVIDIHQQLSTDPRREFRHKLPRWNKNSAPAISDGLTR